MRPFIFLCTVLFAMVSCSGQETSKNNNPDPNDKEQAKNTAPKPQESWTVDKEVDENGNIIRMDSTYTWSFSPDGKELSPETMDSLMNRFRQNFGAGIPDMFGEDFFSAFPSDSTFFHPFSNDSLFRQSMDQRHKLFRDMMRRADSLHRNSVESFGKMNKI
ncbi:hypothetical protein [Sinomicrobium pectinilyticum]|nr:hypothetical protein [Sinomicrobium pectinilyticum]